MNKWSLKCAGIMIYLGLIVQSCSAQSTRNLSEKEYGPAIASEKKAIAPKSNSDFAYVVGPRFVNRVTKETVDNALSIDDIYPQSGERNIVSYHNTLITKFAESRKDWIYAKGEKETFNPAQIELLQKLPYGSSFSITGNIKFKVASGAIEEDTLIQYMTILPTNPVTYKLGNENLISYLKKESKEAVEAAGDERLNPGRISFIVTKEGKIEQVKISNSSNFDSIDKRMLQIIQEIPGKWNVATNVKGEKVDQELIFSFGATGC